MKELLKNFGDQNYPIKKGKIDLFLKGLSGL